MTSDTNKTEPLWAYLMWCGKVAYRRADGAETSDRTIYLFDWRIGRWIPSSELARRLMGLSTSEDDAMLVDPRVAEHGLKLIGSPPQTEMAFPAEIMIGIHALDIPGHIRFLKLMGGGASLTENERKACESSLHWLRLADRDDGRDDHIPLPYLNDDEEPDHGDR